MIGNLILGNRWRSRVIVTLKSGDAFDGVLWSNDRRALVLRGASAVAAGERRENLPLDGEVIVLLSDVAFMQRP